MPDPYSNKKKVTLKKNPQTSSKKLSINQKSIISGKRQD